MAEDTATHFDMTAVTPRRLSRRESELSDIDAPLSESVDKESSEQLERALQASLSKPSLPAASRVDEQDISGKGISQDTSVMGIKVAATQAGVPGEVEYPADTHVPPTTVEPIPARDLRPTGPLGHTSTTGLRMVTPTMVARPVSNSVITPTVQLDTILTEDVVDGNVDKVERHDRLRRMQPWLLRVLAAIQVITNIIIIGLTAKIGLGNLTYLPSVFRTWAAVFCLTTVALTTIVIISVAVNFIYSLAVTKRSGAVPFVVRHPLGIPAMYLIHSATFVVQCAMLILGSFILAALTAADKISPMLPNFWLTASTVIVSWVCLASVAASEIATYNVLNPVWHADDLVLEVRKSASSSKVAPARPVTSIAVSGSYGMGAPAYAVGKGREIPAIPLESVSQLVEPAERVEAAPAVPEILHKIPFLGTLLRRGMRFFGASRLTPRHSPLEAVNEAGRAAFEKEFHASGVPANMTSPDDKILMKLKTPTPKASVSSKGKQETTAATIFTFQEAPSGCVHNAPGVVEQQPDILSPLPVM
jgi:hypothetical protein